MRIASRLSQSAADWLGDGAALMQSIEGLNADDTARVTQLRDWVVGHYAGAEAYESVDGKLKLIQTILDKKWIEKSETLKLQALGISFGDALEQDVDALSWVMVDDEFGRDPALRWMETEILAFPLTSISKRVEDGVDVDVYDLFDGYKKSLEEARRDSL